MQVETYIAAIFDGNKVVLIPAYANNVKVTYKAKVCKRNK